MTDAEMMRLAAKAAGAEMTDYSDRTPDHWIIERAPRGWVNWNPLDDDGDALRLAVKLGIDVQQLSAMGMAEAWKYPYQAKGEEYGSDPYAATRRAIFRAAAEIGRQERDKQ